MSAGTLLLGVVLSGCTAGTAGHYDYEFEAAEAVGVWTVDNPNGTVELDIRADGTFTAKDWPGGLSCDGSLPEPGDDLDELWTRTVTFSGVWNVGEYAVYNVAFVSNGSECRSNWSADAWVVAGGPTRLKVDMSPRTPETDWTDAQYLFFEKT